eukprot:TRINITY_DN798_c0_g1_i1.p1 TRINITY_DN798_c0_g1~~TRINITY_DN798_c0_g1_i1.p1  ORF type:complete len:414 (-),score=61.70 TRINITY_DN798_c0_g1_i1:1098-2339(-)
MAYNSAIRLRPETKAWAMARKDFAEMLEAYLQAGQAKFDEIDNVLAHLDTRNDAMNYVIQANYERTKENTLVLAETSAAVGSILAQVSESKADVDANLASVKFEIGRQGERLGNICSDLALRSQEITTLVKLHEETSRSIEDVRTLATVSVSQDLKFVRDGLRNEIKSLEADIMGLRENSRESILSLKNEFRDTTLKMSCEGQANANKLREIKDNLEGLDRDTRDKVSELQRMAATVEKLIRENKRNTEEFRDAKRNIEDLSEWKQEKEAKLQGMKSNLDSLSQEIKKNSDDLREFKITLEGLVQLTERKTNEIDRLKLNYEDLARETKKNANLQSKLRELKSQLEGVKKDIIGRLDDIEDRLASVESEKAVEGDTPSLRRELKSLATTMEALKADVSSIKKDRETYTTRDTN